MTYLQPCNEVYFMSLLASQFDRQNCVLPSGLAVKVLLLFLFFFDRNDEMSHLEEQRIKSTSIYSTNLNDLFYKIVTNKCIKSTFIQGFGVLLHFHADRSKSLYFDSILKVISF